MTQLASRSNEYRASLVAIWSALTVVYLVWGSTYLAIRFAVETTPPFLMAATRFIISGGCLLVWRRAAGDAGPTALEWRNAAIIGFFLLILPIYVPFLQRFFGTVALNASDWTIIAGISAAAILAVEIIKLFFRWRMFVFNHENGKK